MTTMNYGQNLDNIHSFLISPTSNAFALYTSMIAVHAPVMECAIPLPLMSILIYDLDIHLAM